MGKIKDITGQKFDKLKAVEFVGLNQFKRAKWKCVCECGNELIVDGNHLRTGHTKSCGCVKIQRVTLMGKNNKTHGGHNTRLYRTWDGMKVRCFNISSKLYRWYGAKGIKVCDEWLDFSSFKEWAKLSGYNEWLTIDRIDPRGDYKPNNCQWLTRSDNSRKAMVDRCLNGGK